MLRLVASESHEVVFYVMLQHPMYAGSVAGAGCYGVAMTPSGTAMMPGAGMIPSAYGMPAMYSVQPVCHIYHSIHNRFLAAALAHFILDGIDQLLLLLLGDYDVAAWLLTAFGSCTRFFADFRKSFSACLNTGCR